MEQFKKLDLSKLPTPCFVVDEYSVEQNLKQLQYVSLQSGAKILAALKAFSMWHLGSLTNKYLSGICASGFHEAQLGYEEYGGEIHVFSAAFSDKELNSVIPIANHIVLNSLNQWHKFKVKLKSHPQIEVGLRINPEHSEGTVPLYDPCSKNSRLGITYDEFVESGFFSKDLTGISGLHFHTLCEQGFEPLDRTLSVFEEKFSEFLYKIKWVNFGGGHHITQDNYDVDSLVNRIKKFSGKYGVQVYLEPGEAIAVNSGVLVSEILDIRGKKDNQVILDTSATCHMPDVLEMPYRPEVLNGSKPNQKPYNYQFGGMTCLAGDNLGEYSFSEKLKIGDRIVFMDMSHYTMVKTTTFNGINLPSIVLWNSQTNQLQTIKRFGYEDFKHRLS